MSAKEVFITYSWDNDEHCERIMSFTNFLRQRGFNAEIDRMLIQQESAIDFKKMMHRAMTDYKKVIVVLSKGYKEKAEAFRGGVGNEYTLILNDIETNKNKYILVSLDGINDDIAPLFFKGREIIDLSDNTNKEQEKLFAKLQDIKEYQFAEVASSKPIIKQKTISNFIIRNNISKNNPSLEEFCNILKINSNLNVLKILQLSLSSFVNATTYIEDNPEDKNNGVVAVYVKNAINLFDTFEYCVHKVFDNGDKQYLFYITTTDVQRIVNISNILYENLGIGLYDNRVKYSFKDINQIEDIACGYCTSDKDECSTMWLINDRFTLLLSYFVNPLQQFVLSIEEKKLIELPNLRRNDSLLNYINFDLNEALKNSKEFYRKNENNKVKYIDYIGNLPISFLDIFTKIKIRVFGDKKEFDQNLQTHLYFYTQNNILILNNIQTATNRIISIYGKDNVNSGELEDYEIKNINQFGSWLGRSYTFNTENKLWNSKNKGESLLYDVRLEYDEFTEEGLCLSIIGFDKLVQYQKDLI